MKEEDIRKREVLNRYLELVQEDCRTIFNEKDRCGKVNCPACGGSVYLYQFNKNGFDYVTCEECQTLFVQNRPPREKLVQFYTQSCSSTYWVREFFKPVAEVRRQAIFQPRAQHLVKQFGKDPAWVVGDIGAGFGLFMEELRKLWPASNYIAIEPSQEQADICRQAGLQVECSFFEEIEGYDGHFDLLTAFELLEHLYDPSFFLEGVYRMLRPGGWFFLTTLNGQGFDIQVLWEKSKAISPPHHLNFFNPESLSRLLRQRGFLPVEVDTPGKLDWDIVEGMIVNEGIELGRFWKLFSEKGSIEAKQGFQDWLSRHLFSSHVRVLARKQT